LKGWLKMLPKQDQFKFPSSNRDTDGASTPESLELVVTLDVRAGGFEFDWLRQPSAAVAARGQLTPSPQSVFRIFDLDLKLEVNGKTELDHCYQSPASIHALLKRLRKALPVAEDGLRLCVRTDADIGPAKAGAIHPARAPAGEAAWNWLAREVQRFAKVVQIISEQLGEQPPQPPGPVAALFLAHGWLGVPLAAAPSEPGPPETARLTIRAIKDFVDACIAS
jgi:hypothetical protein